MSLIDSLRKIASPTRDHRIPGSGALPMSRNTLVALSPRDIEILSVLSVRVRLLSLDQIQRTWWPQTTTESDACQRRLQRLRQAGLLVNRQVMAIELAEFSTPLAAWEPGRYVPDLGALAWRL